MFISALQTYSVNYADRIRQACEGWETDNAALGLIREAALSYADLLDGPTDEDDISIWWCHVHLYGVGWGPTGGPARCPSGSWVDGANTFDCDLVEAVFQARKEADRG